MTSQDALLRAAQKALGEGRKGEARELLQKALRRDPENARAWLWLAGIAPSARASLSYIERAERLAPGDETVARARAWAEAQLGATESDLAADEAAPAAAQADVVTSGAAPLEEMAADEGEDAGDDLRELRSRIRHEREESESRRPRWLRPATALALIALFAVLAGMAWSNGLLPNGNKEADSLAAGAANSGAPLTAERDGEGDVPSGDSETSTEDRTVRGQFAPRNVVATTGADDEMEEPTATATRPPLSAKPLAAREEGQEPRPTWTLTPTPTPTPSPTPSPVPTFVSNVAAPQPAVRPAGVGPSERWIDVNLSSQLLVAYEGSTPVYQSLVSSGTWNHPTVTGQFRIWLRYRAQTMDGRRLGYNYYLENVPYVMYFYEDYALHGTYWHNNFGTQMSHGCVNLPTPAAEWIYNWSSMGTVVNVHY